MIYTDIVFFNEKMHFDLRFDEAMNVNEMLHALSGYFPIEEDKTVVFSKNLRRALIREESLERQGVRGGDTLLVVEETAVQDDRAYMDSDGFRTGCVDELKHQWKTGCADE